jgi:argininosuccinate lyase
MAQPQAAAPAPEKKLWGGRFTGKVDPLMEKFNESLSVDKRMAQEDIKGSQVRDTTYIHIACFLLQDEREKNE